MRWTRRVNKMTFLCDLLFDNDFFSSFQTQQEKNPYECHASLSEALRWCLERCRSNSLSYFILFSLISFSFMFCCICSAWCHTPVPIIGWGTPWQWRASSLSSRHTRPSSPTLQGRFSRSPSFLSTFLKLMTKVLAPRSRWRQQYRSLLPLDISFRPSFSWVSFSKLISFS